MLDVIQDVGATWRLWMRGIHIDIIVPGEKLEPATTFHDLPHTPATLTSHGLPHPPATLTLHGLPRRPTPTRHPHLPRPSTAQVPDDKTSSAAREGDQSTRARVRGFASVDPSVEGGEQSPPPQRGGERHAERSAADAEGHAHASPPVGGGAGEAAGRGGGSAAGSPSAEGVAAASRRRDGRHIAAGRRDARHEASRGVGSMPAGTPSAEAAEAAEAAGRPLPADAAEDGVRAGMKTITVDWEEPSEEQRAAGAVGSLSFTITLPLVLVRANVKAGRLWADSLLLSLGRFSDVAVVFDDGEVHAKLRVTAERDGAYLSIESLSLACSAIRIESISEHSFTKRWGIFLGTVTGMQWLLKGFLERKLLGLISTAVVNENQHQRLVAWTEIPLFRDLDASMERWEALASQREAREHHAVRTLQAAWGARRLRRQELAARLVAVAHQAVAQAAADGRLALLPAETEEAEPEAELW